MAKDKNTVAPTDIDTLANTIVKKNTRQTDEAIESFAKLTQQETQKQSRQSKDGLNELTEGDQRTVLFKKINIRSIYHNKAWWFSVIDVVEAISETDRPRKYWKDLKYNVIKQGLTELSDKIGQLKLTAKDGKLRKTDCVNTETLFRLIQSIPSPKAEPFKKWLAKVGYERILEIEDPEIAIKRAIATYRAKGYDDKWINTRISTIVARKELTNEWKKRGVKEKFEYAVLTDTISQGTFDLTTKQHKNIKELSGHHNLRDHMTPLELALVILGETTTAELAKMNDSQGFKENKESATLGGKIAGGTRKNIESKLGKKVVSEKNYLPMKKDLKLETDKKH